MLDMLVNSLSGTVFLCSLSWNTISKHIVNEQCLPLSSYVLITDVFLSTGELDPERMGSGIQYGDGSLRRLQKQQTKTRPDCPC